MNLLNCVGVGTVARNKETNTNNIFVYLPGYFPSGDGEISGQAKSVTESGQTKDGTTSSSTVLRSNVVVAEWHQMNDPHRLTSPDVRVGSKVALYRWGDENKLYWTSYGFAGETHRLESVMWGFNASGKTDANTPFSADNFYVMEMNTRSGRISLRTSMANGEKASFAISVNGKEGTFSVADNEGNVLGIDSVAHSFFYQNEEKTQIVASKKKIMLSSEDSINFKATESISLITKVLTIQTERTAIQAPKGISLVGDTGLLGNLSVVGGISATAGEGTNGSINAAGDIEAQGSVHATGDVTADNGRISLVGHGHDGIQRGGDKSYKSIPL